MNANFKHADWTTTKALKMPLVDIKVVQPLVQALLAIVQEVSMQEAVAAHCASSLYDVLRLEAVIS